jgi:hypothetical protein
LIVPLDDACLTPKFWAGPCAANWCRLCGPGHLARADWRTNPGSPRAGAGPGGNGAPACPAGGMARTLLAYADRGICPDRTGAWTGGAVRRLTALSEGHGRATVGAIAVGRGPNARLGPHLAPKQGIPTPVPRSRATPWLCGAHLAATCRGCVRFAFVAGQRASDSPERNSSAKATAISAATLALCSMSARFAVTERPLVSSATRPRTKGVLAGP